MAVNCQGHISIQDESGKIKSENYTREEKYYSQPFQDQGKTYSPFYLDNRPAEGQNGPYFHLEYESDRDPLYMTTLPAQHHALAQKQKDYQESVQPSKDWSILPYGEQEERNDYSREIESNWNNEEAYRQGKLAATTGHMPRNINQYSEEIQGSFYLGYGEIEGKKAGIIGGLIAAGGGLVEAGIGYLARTLGLFKTAPELVNVVSEITQEIVPWLNRLFRQANSDFPPDQTLVDLMNSLPIDDSYYDCSEIVDKIFRQEE